MRYLVPLLLLIGCDLDSGPDCRKGKRCGNTCIAKDKICHTEATSPPPPMNPYFAR